MTIDIMNISVFQSNGTLLISSPPTLTKDMIPPLVYLGCLFILGIPGNSLVMAVFSLRRKPSAYRSIILFLGINDLLICSVSVPFEFFYLNHHMTFRDKWICKVFRTLNYMFVYNSVLVLQLMAIERFRRVCKPLQIQMSNKVGKICIAGIFVFSVIYTLPNVFIRGIHTLSLPGNRTGYECSTSDDYKQSVLPFIYTVSTISICAAHISIFIIVYVCIGRQIYRHFVFVKSTNPDNSSFQDNTVEETVHTKSASLSETADIDTVVKFKERLKFSEFSFRRKYSSTRSSERSRCRRISDSQNHKCTKIAILITSFFIVSYIPNLVLSALSGIYGDNFLSENLSTPVLHLLQRTYVINHVINPMIYGFIDRRFRIDCKHLTVQLFRRCLCK